MGEGIAAPIKDFGNPPFTIPPSAPKLTLLEMIAPLAPTGRRGSLRKAKSAFVFAVKSQSSLQLIESVLSLISGLEPRERKKSRHSA